MSPPEEEKKGGGEEPPTLITEIKTNSAAVNVSLFQLRQTHQSGLIPD